nr:MAG TPA: protein of unknown function (DUF2828) [Caudoviricetes sp.]
MNFMNALEKGQISRTENGAVGNLTTGSKLVDLNFKIPSFRNGIDKYAFIHALNEDKLLALKWLLYLRDVREGVGERKSFREFVVALVDYDLEIANTFIKGVDIAEYGRWDDYVDIAYKVQNDFIRNLILNKIDTQLAQDMHNMDDGKPVSLLAKWLPSVNASSKETKGKAKMVCRYFQFTERDYRRTLSELRAYIDVVERKMSANNWGEVNYEGVPSKANVLYKNAFSRHDEERRNEYLESLKSGNAKINANAMFLHDIVQAYHSFHVDDTLEEMWKAQKKCDGFENTLVVRDGSGSMTCSVGNSGVTALTVATAITLYCAENNSGEFHNKFITFGSRPKLCDISGLKTLRDKLDYSYREADCSSTDIEKTFKLILNTAIENNIPQEDMPKTVLIVSDMEFNAAQGYYGERNNSHLFKGIQRDFEGHGYKMPKLVFWNVNSRTNTIPITENENGVVLMGGFSKNLLQMAMSSETDPYKVLVAQLNKPRYEIIDKIFKNRA